MIEKLHLVDGTFELFRFHYSGRPQHDAKNGQPVKATIGMMEGLCALLESADEAVTHIAVAFDNPIRSFRNDLFDGYKTEEGVDPTLLAQFDLAERAVRALGVTVWSMSDFEADDGLATGVARFKEEVTQVRVLSPDKDLCQIVDGARVVLVDRIRKKVIDEAEVLARFGILPRAIPVFLGLVGDSADGIPGIEGFGEKSTQKLLAAFGSLESIPDDPKVWPKGIRGADRLAQNLASKRAEAELYKRLATLSLDAPVSASLEEVRFRGVESQALHELAVEIASERIEGRGQRLTPRD